MAKKTNKEKTGAFRFLAVFVSKNCTTLANRNWPYTLNVDLWTTPREVAAELRRIADWLERL